MRRHLFALLVVVLVAGCTWPQFHGDAAHTGFQPVESKIGPSTVASLSEVWTGLIAATSSSPVVAGGRVYIGGEILGASRGSLQVFDAAGVTNCSGTPKVCLPVREEVTDQGVSATPAVGNGLVYVVDELGGLTAYSTTDCGRLACGAVWGADVLGPGGGSTIGSPVVSGNMLYVGATSRIWAFDAAGQTNCTPTPVGSRGCLPLWTADTDSPVYATVAVAGGVLYAISSDGTLYAYDAAGVKNCAGSPKVCSPLWTAVGGGTGVPVQASPVAGGGRVYTVDGAHVLRAFDAPGVTNCAGSPKVCTPLWHATVPSSPGTAFVDAPALANGLLYVGTAVYDAAGVTGCSGIPTVCSPRWRVSEGGRLPIVANGIEFTGGSPPSGGGAPLPMQAFDATGATPCSVTPTVCNPLWTVDVTTPVYGSPAILNGQLYVATSADELMLRVGTLHVYAPTSP